MRSLLLNLPLLTAQNWVPGPLASLGASRLGESQQCAPVPATAAIHGEGLSSLTAYTSPLSASQVPYSKDLLSSPKPHVGLGGLKDQHKNQRGERAQTS